MIQDRPAHLLADPSYSVRPPLPYRIDMSPVPDLVVRSITDLAGIQPITKAMFDAAGGELADKPSEGEVALFRAADTEFQLISIIASRVPKAGHGEGYGTPPSRSA